MKLTLSHSVSMYDNVHCTNGTHTHIYIYIDYYVRKRHSLFRVRVRQCPHIVYYTHIVHTNTQNGYVDQSKMTNILAKPMPVKKHENGLCYTELYTVCCDMHT